MNWNVILPVAAIVLIVVFVAWYVTGGMSGNQAGQAISIGASKTSLKIPVSAEDWNVIMTNAQPVGPVKTATYKAGGKNIIVSEQEYYDTNTGTGGGRTCSASCGSNCYPHGCNDPSKNNCGGGCTCYTSGTTCSDCTCTIGNSIVYGS
jgi:hypothetical protein